MRPPAWFFVCCVALLGCSKPSRANVECVGTNDGFNCTVHHVEGTRPVLAHWNIQVECANGQRVIGAGEQTVQPGGKSTRLIPNAQLVGLNKCDKAVSSSVAGTRLTEL